MHRKVVLFWHYQRSKETTPSFPRFTIIIPSFMSFEILELVLHWKL